MSWALVVYLAAVNVVAFVIYGADKYRARHNKCRIPERTLLGLAFVGGGGGAAIGMGVFHHKTRKRKFQIGVPLAVVLWMAVLYLLETEIGRYLLDSLG